MRRLDADGHIIEDMGQILDYAEEPVYRDGSALRRKNDVLEGS